MVTNQSGSNYFDQGRDEKRVGVGLAREAGVLGCALKSVRSFGRDARHGSAGRSAS